MVSVKLIDVSTKKYPRAFAAVDDDCYDFLMRWTWHLDGRGYVCRSYTEDGMRVRVFMHRAIMEVTQFGRERTVDHINGNPLDNRRQNLRVCSTAQNAHNSKRASNNTSGYKGVSWHKKDKKWQARICVGKKSVFLGNFDSVEAAYDAYCMGARKFHGEFANFGSHNSAVSRSEPFTPADCS